MSLKTLFHLHTTYTDGMSLPRDYFAYAKIKGIRKLIFLEHIRKRPTYDVHSFVQDIKVYSQIYSLLGIVGFEAKILPDGELDIDDDHLQLTDFVGIAEHSFNGSAKELMNSFRKICDYYPRKYPSTQFVWVHPGLWFKKNNILFNNYYFSMLDMVSNCPLKVEVNLRYRLLQPENIVRFPLLKNKILLGLDAHSVSDINKLLSSRYAAALLRYMTPNFFF